MYKVCLTLLITSMLASCQKDLVAPQQIIDDDIQTRPRAVYSSRSINFNNYAPGNYTEANAANDFGNVYTWSPSRTYISNQNLRVTLLANDLGKSGGLITGVDIPNHTQYTLRFDVRFHTDFHWGRGGKVGLGFKIGEGNSGCDPATDGNGGSARMMWTTHGENIPPRFKPYLYFYDSPSDCGYDFGAFYPASGGLQRGVWYSVEIYVKSNNGSNVDGRIKYTINGTVMLDRAIRWTTNQYQRTIKQLVIANYRGGSTPDWMAPVDSHIYFDNISWSSPYS